MTQTQDGGCYCGQVRYRVTGPAKTFGACHCRECQYISGGGPNYFQMRAGDSLTFIKGTPKAFARSDLEQPRVREFCPNCGTHLLTRLPDRDDVVLKVGTLDDPASAGAVAFAIFCDDAQPFHQITPDVPTFAKRPPAR